MDNIHKMVIWIIIYLILIIALVVKKIINTQRSKKDASNN
jgi:flagellar biogenesis protein FliO